MSNRKVLLTLFIHRRTREKYNLERDQHITMQKECLEEIHQEPFDSLPQDRQKHYLDSWIWPPWRFNDIVGYAEIELETSTNLIGHLYMPERVTRVSKKSLLLHEACASARFEENSLQSLREAILEIAGQLKSIIKDRKWVLEINPQFINHTDFLSMIKEMEENEGM